LSKLGNNLGTNITGCPHIGKDLFLITVSERIRKNRKRVKYATT